MSASTFDSAVLPYRQWRVFWVRHEVSAMIPPRDRTKTI